MTTSVLSPVGRIVWGHPTRGQKKTDDKGIPVLKDGVQVTQWVFGLAIPKADFEAIVWPAMAQEIATGFPNNNTPGNFAYKYTDGDTAVDQKGGRYADKPGCAGCMILTCSTELMCPPVYQFNGQSYDQMAPDAIKTGDFVAVSLNLKVNVSTDPKRKSSIYVNPEGIQFVGYGEEIVSTKSADAMFGGQNFALPPGASATPLNPAPNVGMPGMQPQGQQPPANQYPAQQPAQQPMQQPVQQQPAQQPMQQPVQQQPAQQPMQQMPPPAQDFTSPGGQQPMQQPAQQPMQQPAQQPMQQMPGAQPPR